MKVVVCGSVCFPPPESDGADNEDSLVRKLFQTFLSESPLRVFPQLVRNGRERKHESTFSWTPPRRSSDLLSQSCWRLLKVVWISGETQWDVVAGETDVRAAGW